MAIRVLIADGSGLTRDIVRHHLQCAGCEVVAEAQTAAQAMDLFRTVRPEVVALDAGLPGVGGIDALELFRTIRREAPETSVIMLSAACAPANHHAFLDEGALDCLVEPFDLGFKRMWRSLCSAHPELNRAEAASTGPSRAAAHPGRFVKFEGTASLTAARRAAQSRPARLARS